MKNNIAFKFQPDLPHQSNAILAITKTLSGIGRVNKEQSVGLNNIVRNFPEEVELSYDFLLGNLQEVQKSSDIAINPSIEFNKKSTTIDIERYGSHQYPVYTVEMETGTGKTYVYLKSIYELNKEYGFTKFIIVVPSVAIWEGVQKTIDQTRSHFKMIYGKIFNPYILKGKNINALKNFAIDTNISVLILTIDSFNKKNNQVYNPTEKIIGSNLLPIEYVQKTRPILILDESQNYLADASQKALSSLKPLIAYNYSATPKEKPNLINYLSPIDALKFNLVKRIQVLGVSDEEDHNSHLGLKNMTLESVDKNEKTGKIEAKIRAYKIKDGVKKKATLKLSVRDVISQKTKNDDYTGLVVENIKLRPKSVVFENGDTIELSSQSNISESKEDLFREQIKQTIRFHIARQRDLKEKGIKVLSVFFIDRVANYVTEDGLIKRLFDEEFKKQRNNLDSFNDLSGEEVRDGYFSQVSINNSLYFVDEIEEKYDKKTVDTIRKSQAEAQKQSFELIMKNKEELLSFKNKKCFIFAHSALKEGWDNPNVFQICTLRETPSDDTKRQIIGRGMRLAVDQEGNRWFDEDVNILTVIPNESYKSFCSTLQHEYESNGDVTPAKPRDAKKALATRNDDAFNSEEFKKFWKKLSKKSSYKIKIDSEKLIQECIDEFNSDQNVINKRKITLTFGEFSISRVSLRLVGVKNDEARIIISKKNTHKDSRKVEDTFKVGDILDNEVEELKDYKIVEIHDRGNASVVQFSNGQTLSFNKRIKFHINSEASVEENEVLLEGIINHNVDFIKRTMDATHLTRRTLVKVYEGISEEKKKFLKHNPEGFANAFVSVTKGALAEHIAKNIEYEIVESDLGYNAGEMFPKELLYVQRELVAGSKNALYDQIQTDSMVEENFVLKKLHEDDKEGNILTYFKFPPRFKISLPKIIGNYNPDWGIIRRTNEGKLIVELVRETKGHEDTSKLQAKNEGRKIKCAEKYFDKIGVSYRHVTDKTDDWMEDRKRT